MGRPKGSKTQYFRTVKEAREVLQAKALEIFEKYYAIIDQAAAAGDYEFAGESLRWLMEHMPEVDGERMIDASVNKKNDGGSGAPAGPQIQIGIALGGVERTNQKALPVVTIEENEDE